MEAIKQVRLEAYAGASGVHVGRGVTNSTASHQLKKKKAATVLYNICSVFFLVFFPLLENHNLNISHYLCATTLATSNQVH